MSDTDSFIEEVTEEVRRDQLYGYLRKYGWIAALAVVLIVGGAAFSEFRKAQAVSAAEDLGDRVIAALENSQSDIRAQALEEIQAPNAESRAALDMVTATELANAGRVDEAVARLEGLSLNTDVPLVYRQVAGFKAVLAQSETLDTAARLDAFGQFATPGHPLRMLAEEQIALISIELGNTEAALTQLQAIISDAEASSDLQQRAMQVMVALGGTPEVDGATDHTNNN